MRMKFSWRPIRQGCYILSGWQLMMRVLNYRGLADIIDFDPKRTPSVLFSHLAVKNPVSLNEWKKHQSINAWTISPARYYHIGEGKLRTLIDTHPNEDFYVMNGNRALIKREKFERYLDQATAV